MVARLQDAAEAIVGFGETRLKGNSATEVRFGRGDVVLSSV
jgi:hypothetical protein